jgi:1-acyl-sn-glycerol-3-phosphate acyltransferase
MPIIGWKAVMAGDILVQRQSARTFKRLIAQTAASLRAGNCLVAFPEGTRSKDGKLSSFKKGPFLMAQKAKVQVLLHFINI